MPQSNLSSVKGCCLLEVSSYWRNFNFVTETFFLRICWFWLESMWPSTGRTRTFLYSWKNSVLASTNQQPLPFAWVLPLRLCHVFISLHLLLYFNQLHVLTIKLAFTPITHTWDLYSAASTALSTAWSSTDTVWVLALGSTVQGFMLYLYTTK